MNTTSGSHFAAVRWLPRLARPRARLLVGLVAVVFATGVWLGLASFALAINIDGIEYAVLGIGGNASVSSKFEIYQSATVINGNVGEGPYTLVTHGIDATINGTWYFDSATDNCSGKPCGADTSTQVAVTGTVTGGFVAKNMAPVVAAAIGASTTYAGLVPTQTFSTLTDGQTITGGAGQNVIKITGAVGISGGGTTLTINSPAGSKVIFQFTGTGTTKNILTLSGTTMFLTGGITAGDIVWDFNGASFDNNKSDITISSGATVYGTFLGPDQSITVDHGNILGEVIGGGDGGFVSIHSSSQITAPPTTPVPEPITMFLGGTGLLALGYAARKRLFSRSV